MTLDLQILLIHAIIYFLKAIMILNVKVVPNDFFKFCGERVNLVALNHYHVPRNILC